MKENSKQEKGERRTKIKHTKEKENSKQRKGEKVNSKKGKEEGKVTKRFMFVTVHRNL